MIEEKIADEIIKVMQELSFKFSKKAYFEGALFIFFKKEREEFSIKIKNVTGDV